MLNPLEKISGPWDTHEKKFCTHEIPTRKNFGPTKYPREKTLDTRNTHKTRNTPENIFWTHEIPTRKYFGPTKYPRKHFGARHTDEGTMALNPRDPQWNATHEILLTRKTPGNTRKNLHLLLVTNSNQSL